MTRPRRPRRPERREDLEQQLLEVQSPSFNAWYVSEPRLQFGRDQRSIDPKQGLALYGPIDSGDHPVIRVGVVGTGETIDRTEQWIERARRLIEPSIKAGASKAPDPILFPAFPGFSQQTSFRSELRVTRKEVLAPRDLVLVTGVQDFGKRIQATVDLVAAHLENMRDSESPPDVVIAAMPKNVDETCRIGAREYAESRVPLTRAQKQMIRFVERSEEQGQALLFDMRPSISPLQAEAAHRSFHRYLKVKAMKLGLPVQLIWPRTFENAAGTQDEATIAWNLAVGIYYKAGGIPWRVTGLDRGTCYVGISFYRELGGSPSLRTSMAQAFSEATDGIVLRGEPFQWDSSRRGKAPHLKETDARTLLERLLAVYEKTTQQKPARVVVHKSSYFTPEEQQGFLGALQAVPHHDLVALRSSSLTFLRIGTEPPIRGTAIDLGSGRYLLYTRGYVPFLGVYPGMRVPSPLEIHQHIGTGTIRRICDEVMALTKMNWNTADFACEEPITQAFARQVGLILAEMAHDQEPSPSYRFYM